MAFWGVEEGLAVEPPQVQGPGHPVHRRGRQGVQVPQGQVQVFGKIVGGAHGDVPHLRGMGGPEHPGDGLTEGDVPPGHHHLVELPAPTDNGVPGVPPVLGGVGGDQALLLGHGLNDRGQLRPSAALAGFGIVDK